jgi:hypothetical protein
MITMATTQAKIGRSMKKRDIMFSSSPCRACQRSCGRAAAPPGALTRRVASSIVTSLAVTAWPAARAARPRRSRGRRRLTPGIHQPVVADAVRRVIEHALLDLALGLMTNFAVASPLVLRPTARCGTRKLFSAMPSWRRRAHTCRAAAGGRDWGIRPAAVKVPVVWSTLASANSSVRPDCRACRYRA